MILLLKAIVLVLTVVAAVSFLDKKQEVFRVTQNVCLYVMGAVVCLTCLLVMYEHWPQVMSATDLLRPIEKRKLMVVSDADGSVYFALASMLIVLSVMAMVPPWRKYMWELFSG